MPPTQPTHGASHGPPPGAAPNTPSALTPAPELSPTPTRKPTKKPTKNLAVKLDGWASTSNLRRVLEEVVTGIAIVGAGALVAVGITRLPTALTHLGWSVSDGLARALPNVGIGLVVLAASVALVRATIRIRRQRINGMRVARRLDRAHETRDLFATALAIEAGAGSGNQTLGQAVSARALRTLPQVQAPIASFRAPLGPVAAVGIAAALVTLMPTFATAEAADAQKEDAEELVASPPLSDEALEALKTRAEELQRLEYTPGLSEEAKEGLANARRELESLGDDPDRSLSKLAKAQRALEELERRSRDGGLHDKAALERMKTNELADQLTRALDRGETDTAAAMAEELSRRLEEGETEDAERAARALERALRRAPGNAADPKPKPGSSGAKSGAGAPSRSESEDRARWRNRAEELAENLADGDTGSARAGLDKLADEMRKSGSSGSMERSLGDAAEDIRRARERQLGDMNGEPPPGEGEGGSKGEGEGQGEGQGEGEGESAGPGEGTAPGEGAGPPGGPGAGEAAGESAGESAGPGGGDGEGDAPPSMGGGIGRPGGKPGPGGGDGAEDTKGASRELPAASTYAPERVDARPSGPPQGSVRAIRRFSEGYRDGREYKQLHDKYESIAESAIRREEIPLTRRDYIKSYFQAVRGR